MKVEAELQKALKLNSKDKINYVFGRIYNDHFKLGMFIALQYLNEEDAVEVVDNVFVSFFERILKEKECDVSNIRRHLCISIKDSSLKKLKDRRNAPPCKGNIGYQKEEKPTPIIGTSFAELSNEEQYIITEHALLNRKFKDISNDLNKSLFTVASMYSRGMTKIKRRFRMNKTLVRISSLVPNSPSYRSIESKLDFNGFQTGTTSNRFKKKTVLAPIIAFAIALVLIPTLIPTFLNGNIFGHGVSTAETYQISQVRLLKNFYIENTHESPSKANKDVTKINTWPSFLDYSAKIYGAALLDFSGEIDESLFDNNCVLAIKFMSCATETSTNYDGNGVTVNDLKVMNDKLFVHFSIPKFGFDECLQKVTFFAVVSKDKLTDDFDYSYEVIQRDTGDKGSQWYDESGNRR